MSAILANQIISMYWMYHADTYVFQRWHIFVTYLLVTWACCACVLFANRALPMVNNLGLFFILGGVFITILVCAIMPSSNKTPYATTAFVWKDWVNDTGYTSDGFVFLMGMLNGAYAVGTPDCVSHLAEEIPNPRVNIPKVGSRAFLQRRSMTDTPTGDRCANGSRPCHSVLLYDCNLLCRQRHGNLIRESIRFSTRRVVPTSHWI